MENTARKISIDKYEAFTAEIQGWTIDELEEWLNDSSKRVKIIKDRLKELQPKTKRKSTRVLADTKRQHKSDIIYERDLMEKIIGYFLDNGRFTMAGICILGFNTGLRFGDIQKLRAGDLMNGDGSIKDKIVIEEEKTRYVRSVYFNRVCKGILEYITENKTIEDYVFTSKGHNTERVAVESVTGRGTAIVRKFISKQAVYDEMIQMSKDLGLTEHYRTHTFRNSVINLLARECADIFRDRAYGNEVAAAFVGHKSIDTTEKYYLALSEQERKAVHDRLEVGLNTWLKWKEVH